MATSPSTGVIAARSTRLPFTINGYEFLSLIGKGGFAEVFLVHSLKYANHPFVAKVMPCDESKYETFELEVGALLNLCHPNIIRLYDHFKIGSQIFMILEYCSRGSLHNEINTSRGLSMSRFIEITSEVVSALIYCHGKGIAHRDIKPGNILIDEYNHSKLADFGLCCTNLHKKDQLQSIFGGSYEYTAPEILQKKPHDPKAGDVWALGVMFVTMSTGSVPWKCDSLGGLKEMAARGKFKFSTPVPPLLEDLVRKMIVVDPNGRLTMEEVAKHPFFRGNSTTIPTNISSVTNNNNNATTTTTTTTNNNNNNCNTAITNNLTTPSAKAMATTTNTSATTRAMNSSSLGSSKSLGGPCVLQWEPIKRKSEPMNDTLDIYETGDINNLFEITTEVEVLTPVRAASTALMHSGAAPKKVRSRYFKAKSTYTFNLDSLDTVDEDVKEV